MKIGITGGSGLLGKILIKIFKKKKLKISCYKKDIRNIKDIKKWLKKNKDINIVIHLAAIVPLDKVDKDKKKSIDVNLNGTKNLYHSISEQNRKIWFFFASTSSCALCCRVVSLVYRVKKNVSLLLQINKRHHPLDRPFI